jgi:hypothetical protein
LKIRTKGLTPETGTYGPSALGFPYAESLSLIYDPGVTAVKIKDVAEQFQLKPSAIRYYMEEALLESMTVDLSSLLDRASPDRASADAAVDRRPLEGRGDETDPSKNV